jgi:hypothetical protein
MIRVSGIATLSDGTTHPFAGGPREFSAWERYALANGLPTAQNAAGSSAGLTMMWFLAYACMTRELPERPAFDDWLNTLVDLADFELEMPTPTRAAASAELSPRSPLAPESPPTLSGAPTPETSRPSRPS